MYSKSNVIVAAAIDFGTTYSGWAFSFEHEYNADPTNIHARKWHGDTLLSMKAPTTVLIQPDGETFDSFGYDAETKYADLVCEDKHQEWYYFRRFKMLLYGTTPYIKTYHYQTYHQQTLNRDVKLEDETHKSLPAMKVFSLAIRYLMKDLIKTSEDRLATGQVTNDDIIWVLTVPAIWNDAAKQFMKEAAIKAGIKEENFRLALEPETASIFCSLLPAEKMVEKGGISSFKTGSKYMVLDAGGGSVDITVHEVMSGGRLKEIHKACGGAWGGTRVDEAFKHLIISLVGESVFRRFEKEKKDDYLDLFRDFEIKKRQISPGNDTKVNIRFPSSLKDTFFEETGNDVRNSISKSIYADQIFLLSDKLRVDASVMKSLFHDVIENIVSHVKMLIKDSRVHGIFSILMVGGFSECEMLQNAMKSNFPNLRIIIPQDAGLVVLKGAVVFGHNPNYIAERVCKYTYGIQTSEPFNERVHNLSKRKLYDERFVCTDIFLKFVEVGEKVVNICTKEHTRIPSEENQTYICFKIYASTNKSPMYVTDEGCVKLGSVTIANLDRTVPRENREVLVSMSFGGTEIEITAKEKRTGNTTRVTVDFLG